MREERAETEERKDDCDLCDDDNDEDHDRDGDNDENHHNYVAERIRVEVLDAGK